MRQQVAERYSWNNSEEAAQGGATIDRPPFVIGSVASEQRLSRLTRTVEAEIIPRLVLAGRAAAERRSAPAVPGPTAEDVAELAGIILAKDASIASAYAQAMHARGMSVEALYLDLLAPAARRLGDLWDADRADFVEVTIGLGRLQQVLRQLGPDFHAEATGRSHGRRALIVSAPGEQHTFGQVMVAEFFCRAGWSVWRGLGESTDTLVDLVRNEWFAIVGFSVGCDGRLERLASAIRAIRRASRNRTIGVMVGGPIFIEHPELAALVGADATAADARQATVQAETMLTLLARLG